jgi:hypothetical protein
VSYVYNTAYVIDAPHCRFVLRHVSSARCDVFLLIYQFLRRMFCASFVYERQNCLPYLVPYVTCFVTQRALIQSPYWTVNNIRDGFVRYITTVDHRLLGCDVVQPSRNTPTIRKNLFPKDDVMLPPKRQYISTGLHGFASQNGYRGEKLKFSKALLVKYCRALENNL